MAALGLLILDSTQVFEVSKYNPRLDIIIMGWLIISTVVTLFIQPWYVLTGSNEGKLRLFSPTTGDCVFTKRHHKNSITAIQVLCFKILVSSWFYFTFIHVLLFPWLLVQIRDSWVYAIDMNGMLSAWKCIYQTTETRTTLRDFVLKFDVKVSELVWIH